jgi:lipopolysaccharide transport protein LptA
MTMRSILIAILAALVLPTHAATQNIDLKLPISLDADSTDYDGKNSMLVFRGLRLTQGSIGIVADEGRATKLDFDDSVWRFNGHVVIDVDSGHIECESADLQFKENQLRLATITGTPATFEIQRPGTDEKTYAEARKLKYNLATGIIEFSGDAILREGGNQVASSFLAYNIAERRFNAQSSGDGDDKVRITYTPKPEPAAGETPADEAPGDRDAGDQPPPGGDGSP